MYGLTPWVPDNFRHILQRMGTKSFFKSPHRSVYQGAEHAGDMLATRHRHEIGILNKGFQHSGMVCALNFSADSRSFS